MRSLALSLCLLAACQPEERDFPEPQPPAPLAPAATIRGGQVLRLVTSGDTLFTSHADADGLWLQATDVGGAILWHTFVTGRPEGELDALRFAAIDADEVWVAWAEDDGVAVWRLGDVDHLQLGGARLDAPARVLHAATRDDGGVDVFVASELASGLDRVARLRFADDGALLDEQSLAGFLGRAYDVAALADGAVIVLGSHGVDPSETLTRFDADLALVDRALVADGPGDEVRLLGRIGAAIFVEIHAGSGAHRVERVGGEGERTSLRLPAGAVAVAPGADGHHAVTVDQDISLVAVDGEATRLRACLGGLDELRVDELVLLTGGQLALRGARQGVEGVFVYALP